MLKFLSPESIARFAAKRPKTMLGIWVLIIALTVAGFGMTKTSNEQSGANTESQQVIDRLEAIRGEESPEELVVITSDTHQVNSPQFEAFVADLAAQFRGLETEVSSVSTFYDTGDAAMISKDGRGTFISVMLAGEIDDAADTVLPVLAVIEATHAQSEYTVRTVGSGSLDLELTEIFEKDLQRSEVYGLPVAAIVLVVVFGAAVAAGLPILMALLAIFLAFGITGVVSNFVAMDDLVMNMIIMIGLAVGIDYTLFIVERFREERANGLDKVEAIVRAGGTASRAVVFSGITVIIALSSLMIMPDSIFHGLSIGAIAAAVGALVSTITLLPALLSLLGDKVNALHLPGRGQRRRGENSNGFWHRTTRLVMAHPVIAIVVSVAILGAAAAPAATIELGSPGVAQMPQHVESIKAYNTLQDQFFTVRMAPVDILIEGDIGSAGVQGSVQMLRNSLEADGRFSSVEELQVLTGDTGLLQAYIEGDSSGSAAQRAVEQLRGEYVPAAFAGSDATVRVGGETAYNVDYIASMIKFLPIVIGFVLALSFVLLLVVFRSIVIPVKAILMNLLSVAAAYGLIVLVFQHGVLAGTLGFTQTEAVTAWLPVFLFAVLFGLSMDYHVFLLSRIQERFLHTGDNRASVAAGLESTAHIITGAAAIMVVVFSAFALGDIVDMQQMGFGLAVAVFIDATIVRSVLVPASMELLGDRNWYLPSWLQWLPSVSVEGGQPVQRPAQQPAGATVPVPVLAAVAPAVE